MTAATAVALVRRYVVTEELGIALLRYGSELDWDSGSAVVYVTVLVRLTVVRSWAPAACRSRRQRRHSRQRLVAQGDEDILRQQPGRD